MNFALTISNNDTGGTIEVTNSSGCNDWRIPSDGLDGFGNMPFDTAQEVLATGTGGVLLGGHAGLRQLVLKLKAPATEEKRDEAARVLAIGTSVTLKATYNRSSARTISGTVTGCKISEGNIYEPTAVTATVECQDPFFRGEDVTKTAYSYTSGSGIAAFSWKMDLEGDSLATLREFTMIYTTKNTEAVTLSRQAAVQLTIPRLAYKPFSLPEQTYYIWNAGSAKGETVAAKTRMEWTVKLDGTLPCCLCNGKSYGMESAVLGSWKGLEAHEVLPTSNTSYMARLSVSMDSSVEPYIMTFTNGKMTYTPGWMGI